MNRFQKRRRNKNDFLDLFNRLKPDTDYQDFHDVSCTAPVGVLEQLSKSDDYKRDLFKFCGIPYNSTYLSFFYEGYNSFAELLALWTYGIRNLMAIDIIMSADKKYLFADEVFKYGMFANYKDEDSLEALSHEDEKSEGLIQTCFSFKEEPWIYEQVRTLLRTCSETWTGYLLADFLKRPKDMKICTNMYTKTFRKESAFIAIVDDIVSCMSGDFLNEVVLPRIKKEGFSQKVYESLFNEMTLGCEEDETLPPPELKILYSQGEEKLEWKYGRYQFILPKTAGEVYKMNDEIFYGTSLFLNLEVVESGKTEICVMRGTRPKAAIEIEVYSDGSFELQSIYLPRKRHNSLSEKDFEILRCWYIEKNVEVPPVWQNKDFINNLGHFGNFKHLKMKGK